MNSVSKRCAKYLSEICASIICLSRAQAQHGNMICWEYACFHLPQQIVTRGNKLAEIKRLRLSFPLMRGWRYLFLAKWKYLQKNCLSFFFFFYSRSPFSKKLQCLHNFSWGLGGTLPPLSFFSKGKLDGRSKPRENKINKESTSRGEEGGPFSFKTLLARNNQGFSNNRSLPSCCMLLCFVPQRQMPAHTMDFLTLALAEPALHKPWLCHWTGVMNGQFRLLKETVSEVLAKVFLLKYGVVKVWCCKVGWQGLLYYCMVHSVMDS